MATVPLAPKLYHITHVDNLPSILADGGLWCDSQLIARGGPPASIGMGGIKARRLTLPVKCHPGDVVGGYVPFYFCPRSLVRRVGALTDVIQRQAMRALAGVAHRPPVEVRRDWYY